MLYANEIADSLGAELLWINDIATSFELKKGCASTPIEAQQVAKLKINQKYEYIIDRQ